MTWARSRLPSSGASSEKHWPQTDVAKGHRFSEPAGFIVLLVVYRAFKRSEGFRGLSRMIGNSVRAWVVYGTLCHVPLDTTAKICGITLPRTKETFCPLRHVERG